MPLTKLDTAAALVVIDLQKGLTRYPTVHPIGTVIGHAAALADAFRRRGLPVVLVTANGVPPGRTEQPRRVTQLPPGFDELVPELNRQPQDHTVTKRQWGAFINTDLESYLKNRGVTQVVIAGVATSIGVESTARHAFECGFNVTLAVDAMTDMDPDAHLNSIARIFPRLGETGATPEILDLLDASGG